MGRRNVKYKKMRDLSQMYKGDNEHDNAPPTTEWEVEFEQERKKTALREAKLQARIEAQKQFQAKRKAENDKRALTELKIQPNESLAEFADRVNTTSRLQASAEANAKRNRTRKAKLEQKRESRRAQYSDEDEDDADVRGKRGKKLPRFQQKQALPRFLDVADRPPEFSITENKKRFREDGQGPQEMLALSKRVQGLYSKNKN